MSEFEDRPAVGFFDLEAAQNHARETMRKKQLERAVAALDGTDVPVYPEASTIDYANDFGVQAYLVRREFLRQRKPVTPRPRITWRDTPYISLPRWLLSRPFLKTGNLLHHGGPDIWPQLELLVQRLSDKGDSQGYLANHLLSLVLWLMQSPNDVRQATRDKTHSDLSSTPNGHPAPESGVELPERGGMDHA